jgi:hypothetical protein
MPSWRQLPRRLKPNSTLFFDGPAEAVPLHAVPLRVLHIRPFRSADLEDSPGIFQGGFHQAADGLADGYRVAFADLFENFAV